MPVSLAWASWGHQQKQAVALWVQQPGFGAEGFLPRLILHAGAQSQGFIHPGVEQGNGVSASRRSLQAKHQSPGLARLRPQNPPVRAAEAWLRFHDKQSTIKPRKGGGIVGSQHE